MSRINRAAVLYENRFHIVSVLCIISVLIRFTPIRYERSNDHGTSKLGDTGSLRTIHKHLTAWTRELAAKVLQEHIDSHPAGTTYRLTQRDAALEWMCMQYGAHLVELVNELGGWDCLGLALRDVIQQQKRRERKH